MSIEQVSELLTTKGGFRRVPKPLHIAELEFGFEFDAVFEGPHDQHGLVLIVDLSRLSLQIVERRVRAFALALSRTNSLRTVCLVLLNPEAGSNDRTLFALELLCRVILVKSTEDPTFALRGVLPIHLPVPGISVVGADEALAEELKNRPVDELMKQLQKAAKSGCDAVQS